MTMTRLVCLEGVGVFATPISHSRKRSRTAQSGSGAKTKCVRHYSFLGLSLKRDTSKLQWRPSVFVRY